MDLAREYFLRFKFGFLLFHVSILVLMDLAREFLECLQESSLPLVSILVLMDLARES